MLGIVRYVTNPFLYSHGKWLLKFKHTHLNAFFQNKDICNSFPTLVIDMFVNPILILCSSSNVNLIFL